MSDIYSSYLSESTQKKENIYASWPKEKNTWGKNTAPAPLVPAPQIPPPRIPPPQIKRDNKPEHVIFKDGYIEQYY
jgi:hypothetical protein